MAKDKAMTVADLEAAGYTKDAEGTWWDGDREINPKTGKHVRRAIASACFVIFNAEDPDDVALVKSLQQKVASGAIVVREGVRKKDASEVLDLFMSGQIAGYIPVMVK